MCKVINTVPALAWLRRAVRRWRSRGAASARPNKDVLELDATVPAGHVAVRLEGRGDGEPSSRRFVVRLEKLSHPAFRELLRQAEEEYGFPSASGPVVLPCDEDHLRDVLRRVSLSEERPSFRRRRGVVAAPHGDCDSWPLLQGAAVEKLVS
ncbi:auxin-responsive protein SAUR50-like [Hordeum vulgare subsp. vulgare]|uniref:Auxin-responsive protein n=1 Tax=Hordeum vulgare subsp. vulgare TaxID=112509 RepID=A0A8I7B413_HORVV|nr:auxin-responsive protein SAUR50-like [Hordeum vulgare subsp. vulgare]